MFVVRYVAGTPLNERRHSETGSYMSWIDAEMARLNSDSAEILEVLER